MSTNLTSLTPLDEAALASLYTEATKVIEREQGKDEPRNLATKYVLIFDMAERESASF